MGHEHGSWRDNDPIDEREPADLPPGAARWTMVWLGLSILTGVISTLIYLSDPS